MLTRTKRNGSGYFRKPRIMLKSQSPVDETLFGPPLKTFYTTNEAFTDTQRHNKYPNVKQSMSNKKDNPNVVTVLDQTLIRSLKINANTEKPGTLFLPMDEWERIKKETQVLNMDNIVAQQEAETRERKAREEECLARKQRMLEIDSKKTKVKTKEEQEAEAQAVSQKKKAEMLMLGREQDIHRLKGLITAAKCHAIRDAQITEKNLIQQELQAEVIRLDDMMEKKRKEAVIAVEESDKKSEQQKEQTQRELKEQMKEREKQRIKALEEREKEAELTRMVEEAIIQEEKEKREKLLEARKRQQESINKENEILIKRKTLEQQQEFIQELKIAEHQKNKAEQEILQEKREREERARRDREFAKVHMKSQLDQKAQNNHTDIKEKRVQEQVEREWRRREIEDLKRRVEQETELQKAREIQIQLKERQMEDLVKVDRAQLKEIKEQQKISEKKEIDKEERRKQMARNHAEELREQINAKAKQKQRVKESRQKEIYITDLQATQHDNLVKKTQQNILNDFKESGIPQPYLQEVTRQLEKIKKQDQKLKLLFW